jgi:hypothetical protein
MECYICYEKETTLDKFVKDPCSCKGSNKIHNSCLKKLIEKNGNTCSICKKLFSLGTVNKPFEKLVEHKPYYEDHYNYNYEDKTYYQEHSNHKYEDKNVSINYSYIGNGNYRVEYKHKNVCVII